VTNRRVKELILNRYKFLRYEDITILPQGYDPEDFTKVAAPPRKPGTMRITHAGVFYGDRTPRYFLEALKKVLNNGSAKKPSIEACFVGNFHDEHAEIVKELKLEEHVVTTGYLDHSHCIEYLLASDVLWFMLRNDRQSPGKLYEYFGARKPILACVGDGFIRQTLEEGRACIITPPEDVDAIAGAISKWYGMFTEGGLPRPQEDVVTKYDRVELTDELSKIFGFLVE
jgi:glycosyltransferase involved in cell wall biosynthesis